MTFFKAVALDFDGTLTSGGNISAHTVAAIEQARRDGLAVVLVSGRIGAELQAEFPRIPHQVDAMVLENGAVTVINGQASALAPPVDGGLRQALTDRGVPYRCGEVLVAADGEHAATIIEVIGELGLDYQIAHNRGALMVLPAGTTKGTGLATVLGG
ncbi:haloacid dehalogenase-like hydrolase family protein [Mycobacterium kansasii 824]|nr:haloacid dehalogenase-like hydrolase family protein [Mycobacterium kansasii 824]OOK66127.1 haloacid dehalogenase-like hydrolase family protein [Mycobacterium kansasii]